MNGLSIQHPGWLALGIAMILVGIWLIRWANRNNMASAIAGAAAEAASKALHKGTHGIPSDIKVRYEDVKSAPTKIGKAKKVAGYGFRHAMSQLFGVIGFFSLIIGLMLCVLGLFYS
jgi:alcohol dehydrogenase class IV